MGREHRDAHVVNWNSLRLAALQDKSMKTLEAIKRELDVLSLASSIDQDVRRELHSLVERISTDIECARGHQAGTAVEPDPL